MDCDNIEGLSNTEANFRRKKYGYNELPDRGRNSPLKIFIGLVTEPMIFLLFTTVVIYFLLGDKNEAFLLLASFAGIVSIEFYQEAKTEKSLQALKTLSSPIATVIRDGKRQNIAGRDLTIGDVIVVCEGSRVPADAELISADNLEVDESLLTGESLSVRKSMDSNDKTMLYSGTLIVKGKGMAIVGAIGASTEIGKIGHSLKSIKPEKTPLQLEVAKVIRFIAVLAIILSISLTVIYWVTRGSLLEGMLAGLTLAISILPEEFPVVLAVFMTLGAWRLAKNKILVRKSHSIETLGSTSVLCVDKTGTLTENRMRIEAILDTKHIDDSDITSLSRNKIIKYGILASQKQPFDPMEDAFITAGKELFGDLDHVYTGLNLVKEYPVDDTSLCVVHAWQVDSSNRYKLALKGAPEAVFELCKISKLDEIKLLEQVKKLAHDGLRVLAVAKGESTGQLTDDRRDFNFELLGLIGLVDPIREGVAEAINLCRQAGVRVIMLTGDYSETALRIAENIGLDCGQTMTGAEFDKLSESERKQVIKKISVFSRVRPSNKLAIVKALKANGEVVAMTGDGVNDAPALKASHVGVAMGAKGTDVAREAASIVLLDDNFTSIVHGIKTGRRIYDNLKKAMSYVIAVHIPIVALSLVPALLKWPLVLIPAHIVFLEFIIDPSCTIIFENEKANRNIMNRPPRKLHDSVFNWKMLLSSTLQGLVISVVVLVSFALMIQAGWSTDRSRGITFLILVVSNIFLMLCISGRQALNNILRLENKAMVAIIAVTFLALILIFTIPFLRELFKFGVISFTDVLIGLMAGIFSLAIIVPFRKLIAHI